MKTPALLGLLFLIAVSPGPAAADILPPRPPTEAGTLEAKVVAVNRGFGFVIVDAGSKKGVKAGMVVAILRDKKWVSGILEIGEIEEKTTVLEYAKGKSDPRDRIEKVRFSEPKANKG